LHFTLINCSPVSSDARRRIWQQLVQSFVACRLDYCNALLYDISGGLIQRLQSVQNATARLVTGGRRRDHITPLLRQVVHWLPVRQRTDFKLAVLVYKSLHGLTPPYLSDDCQLVKEVGRRHLMSSDIYMCAMPRTQSWTATAEQSSGRPQGAKYHI